MRKRITGIMLGLAVLPGAVSAQASSTGIDAGVMLGWMKPGVSSGSGALTDSRFAFGAQADFRLLPEVSAGAFVFTGSTENSVTAAGTTVSQSVRYTPFGLQGAFHFPVLDVAVGGRLGWMSMRTSTTGAADVSSTDFMFGPYGAYDYPILPALSVGADISLLWANTDPNTTWLFSVLATAKYHL